MPDGSKQAEFELTSPPGAPKHEKTIMFLPRSILKTLPQTGTGHWDSPLIDEKGHPESITDISGRETTKALKAIDDPGPATLGKCDFMKGPPENGPIEKVMAKDKVVAKAEAPARSRVPGFTV